MNIFHFFILLWLQNSIINNVGGGASIWDSTSSASNHGHTDIPHKAKIISFKLKLETLKERRILFHSPQFKNWDLPGTHLAFLLSRTSTWHNNYFSDTERNLSPVLETPPLGSQLSHLVDPPHSEENSIFPLPPEIRGLILAHLLQSTEPSSELSFDINSSWDYKPKSEPPPKIEPK